MLHALFQAPTGTMVTLGSIDGQDFVERIILFSIAGGLAFLFIMSGMIRSMVNRRQQERTKREIAAYVAEGSMTPEEGERLIAAESKSSERRCS